MVMTEKLGVREGMIVHPYGTDSLRLDGAGQPLDWKTAVSILTGQPPGRWNSGLCSQIRQLQGLLRIDSDVVSPQVFRFLHYRLQDAPFMTARLGWRNISLRQAAAIQSVMTDLDVKTTIVNLRTQISAEFPAIGPILRANGRTDISIPARFLSGMFSAYLSPEEREQVEAGIKASTLAPTEYAVLSLMIQGRPIVEIAEMLDISWQTVKNHETKIRAKLSAAAYPVYDRVQASIVALRSGLVPLRLADHYYRGMDRRDLTEYLFVELSYREQDIFSLRVRGYSDKEIARELGISKQTVKNHMSNILLKLDCGSGSTASLVVFSYLADGIPEPIQLKDIVRPREEREAPVRAAIQIRRTVLSTPDRRDAVIVEKPDDIPYDEEHLVLTPGDARMWRQTSPQHYRNPEITQLYASSNGDGTGHYARIALTELLRVNRPFLSSVALDNFIEVIIGTVNAHHPKFTILPFREIHRTQASFQIRALKKFFAEAHQRNIVFEQRPRWKELREDMERVEKELL